MKMPHGFFRCRYCRETFHEKDKTRDHIVPQWAIRAFPELGLSITDAKGVNIAKACKSCNTKKGSIPIAIFVRVKDDPEALYKAQCEWEHVTRVFGNNGPPLDDQQGYMSLRSSIISAYSQHA